MSDERDQSHLDLLTQKLYAKSSDSAMSPKRARLHKKSSSLPTEWKHDVIPEKNETMPKVSHSTFFKKFFLSSLIFFFIAVGFGIFQIFGAHKSISNENIDFNVVGSAFTPGGEPLPLTVEITNRNRMDLRAADLIVEYPKNGVTTDDNTYALSDIERSRISLGTITTGQAVVKEIPVTLFGPEASTRDVKFTLEYHIPESAAIFQKDKIFSVTLSSVPVVVTTEGPQNVVPNQPYTFTIRVAGNTKTPLQNTLVRVEYPIGFQYKEADPLPSGFTNVWDIGDIKEGDVKEIKISGMFVGQTGEERSFRVYVGSKDPDENNKLAIIFSSLLQSVLLSLPQIQTDLFVNGQKGEVITADANADFSGEILWQNNLDTQILNAEVSATLAGDIIDKGSVSVINGYYNSSENTIVWNKNTFNDFKVVAPGANGKLGFTFKTRKGVIGNDSNAKDIVIQVSIKATEETEGVAQTLTSNTSKTTIKFGTDFSAKSIASFSIGPFLNKGEFPPKAEQKTQFTIKWSLSNTDNLLSSVEARASFPANVTFAGMVSPAGEDVSIDIRTGELVWKVGELPRGTGITLPTKDMYFQVELLPSLSDAGTAPLLVKEGKVVGTDTYTNKQVETIIRSTDTTLYGDPIYTPGMERVTK